MDGSLFRLLEELVDIAWVYLSVPVNSRIYYAASFLTDTIERMIRYGHRNRIFLANKAISKYREFRAGAVPVREPA